MDFDKISEEILEDLAKLIGNAAKGFAQEAKADLDAFWKKARSDIKKYAMWLAAGELTEAEFELLVQAKVTNAKLLALSAAGIAKTRLKRLLESVRDVILKAVFAALPI